VIINPKILGEHMTKEYDWEHCLSFPNIRCMVKRPLGVHLSYLNSEGDEIEEHIMDDEGFRCR